MCWVLYVAADRALPLRRFDPAAPGFNVADLTEHEAMVRAQFGKPFVYACGAHTGCGCGFDRGQANPSHPDELAAAEASLRSLSAYLAEALEWAGALELFACWDGDQAAVPDHRWKYSAASFGPEMAWFPDRTFVEVTPRRTPS
jgi:hypothetical protein